MKWSSAAALLVGLLLGVAGTKVSLTKTGIAATPKEAEAVFDEIARGRYLVQVGGCNDCHTPGFMQAPGQIPEAEWLTGVSLGWRGPWGTTYAGNLRKRVHELTEDEWVSLLHVRKDMPPMPWFSVNSMTDADSRSLYRYLRHLGNAGEHVPAYVPPDQEPGTPYLSMNVQFAGEGAAVKELRMERPAK